MVFFYHNRTVFYAPSMAFTFLKKKTFPAKSRTAFHGPHPACFLTGWPFCPVFTHTLCSLVRVFSFQMTVFHVLLWSSTQMSCGSPYLQVSMSRGHMHTVHKHLQETGAPFSRLGSRYIYTRYIQICYNYYVNTVLDSMLCNLICDVILYCMSFIPGSHLGPGHPSRTAGL